VLRSYQQLLIGIVYHSLSSSGIHNSRLILSAIRSINDLNSCCQALLIGDFNVPGTNWENLDYTGNVSSLAADLLDATIDAYLYQNVTDFTHHRSGQKSSILDLVFISMLIFSLYNTILH